MSSRALPTGEPANHARRTHGRLGHRLQRDGMPTARTSVGAFTRGSGEGWSSGVYVAPVEGVRSARRVVPPIDPTSRVKDTPDPTLRVDAPVGTGALCRYGCGMYRSRTGKCGCLSSDW